MVSEAHDEYWSPAIRATVTRARDRGVNVAFSGPNAIFRKIRFESSPLGPDRIEVNYKIPQEDPLYGKDNALVTGNWPSPPDVDPESSLVGQSYVCSVAGNFPKNAATSTVAGHTLVASSATSTQITAPSVAPIMG